VLAITILVIDDETVFLDAVTRILKRRVYDVRVATGPLQAIEIITSKTRIDVVVSDVGLPQMRGTELVREIAVVSPETACILMTGGAIDWAEVPKGITLLRKPFSSADLFRAIQDSIGKRPIRPSFDGSPEA
jgi:DNA-binding NtrC family response regulator